MLFIISFSLSVSIIFFIFDKSAILFIFKKKFSFFFIQFIKKILKNARVVNSTINNKAKGTIIERKVLKST
jgi:hypothetical protein